MLMTPSLTSNYPQAFAGFGQDGIRHDLNRLYYSDLSRQGMMLDPQFSGAPYYAGYNAMAPFAYAPSLGYPAAPYYGAPYQVLDGRYGYGRPYDYARGYEFGRPYDYARTYEFGRPYDYARGYEFGRPYDYTRGYEFGRQQELPSGRPYDAAQPYVRGFEGAMRPVEGLAPMSGEGFSVPSVNSAETPDAFLLVVELPGVDLKDVNLQIHGSTLVLSAFRRPTWSNGTITVNYHFAEGRFGTLRRVLPLPGGVLPGQIQASFHNGLLTIVLPKSANGASSVPQANIVINSNVPTTM